ncbi:DEAD/DEAH box helicase [Alsobacter sp. SYSU M60028]|uniref:DEAD/DEAH box helicase n=1 Tax=Alsobacter ponti TaxID=2962936 RepID=A0ABT1LH12_9HYPH|nr:DEAD/DEAH box helicase [Alsobacter ponti]MCP8940393.1 DEAD/DEAH box helicase [Alsobacter ponti]
MPFPATHASVERALAERGYAEPTPVQAAVLAPEARDRDLLVSAQTGSGKTIAFGLALVSTLLGEAERFPRAEEPLALVIAPTRELALQVQRELAWLYAPAQARIVSCVGGMDVRREARALAEGCHVVVGTPGRLRDHLERGRLDPSRLRAVVLDEADEMLDLGFREDLEFILDSAPAERRTLLFSATIARGIAALAQRIQRDALRIDTVDRSQPHADIDYKVVQVAPSDVEHAVVNVLRYFDSPGALVFCHTREAVRKLYGSLVERGFVAVALSGEMGQNERNHALQALRDGRARVCVATDVAARGIDLPGLDLVIHAELPRGRDALLHRSGRTGRAGRKGVCVLIAPFNLRRRTEMLLRQAGLEAEWLGPPSAEDVRKRDRDRLMQDPIFSEENTEEDTETARLLMERRSPEEIAAAFVRAIRSRLPEPEDVYSSAPQRDRDARETRRPARERDDAGAGAAYDPLKAERHAGGPMVWFRMSIGRRKNADPRWLLPVICRRGHVTKKDIGAIRIFDNETRFEIAEAAAERFAEAALGRGGKGEDIRFERSEPPGAPGDRQGAPRRARPTSHPREDASGGDGGRDAGTGHIPRPRRAAPSEPDASRDAPQGKPAFKPRRAHGPATADGEPRPETAKPGPGFKKGAKERPTGPKRAHKTKPRRG